jgi:hypothetical protein
LVVRAGPLRLQEVATHGVMATLSEGVADDAAELAGH